MLRLVVDFSTTPNCIHIWSFSACWLSWFEQVEFGKATGTKCEVVEPKSGTRIRVMVFNLTNVCYDLLLTSWKLIFQNKQNGWHPKCVFAENGWFLATLTLFSAENGWLSVTLTSFSSKRLTFGDPGFFRVLKISFHEINRGHDRSSENRIQPT